MPHGIFDIVAENPQVEHVAGDMEQTSMEEHAREHGEDRWNRNQSRR